ncbi:MAG TPA: hypothetical protein VF898_13715 [Chloroflexota bacterium]
MSDQNARNENLEDLAEHVMHDKRSEGFTEEETRELYDLPTTDAQSLGKYDGSISST